jgi:deoxycytidylate deaminase
MANNYDADAIRKYLKIALGKSKCKKHPVAAVIETIERDYIAGWNGAPTGIKHDECSRKGYKSGEGLELCPSIHAERRAISYASKIGMSINKATLYLNEWFPCADCAKSIIEAGIERIVTPDELYSDEKNFILVEKLRNTPYNFEMAEKLFRETGTAIIIDPKIKI